MKWGSPGSVVQHVGYDVENALRSDVECGAALLAEGALWTTVGGALSGATWVPAAEVVRCAMRRGVEASRMLWKRGAVPGAVEKAGVDMPWLTVKSVAPAVLGSHAYGNVAGAVEGAANSVVNRVAETTRAKRRS